MGGLEGKKRKRGRGSGRRGRGERERGRQRQWGRGRMEEGETAMIRWGLLNATPLVQIPPSPTNSW